MWNLGEKIWLFPSIDTWSVCLPWERKDNEICVGGRDKLGLKWQKRDVVWCTQSDEAPTFRLRPLSFVFVVFRHNNLVLLCSLEFTKSFKISWSWSICLASACLQKKILSKLIILLPTITAQVMESSYGPVFELILKKKKGVIISAAV